LILLWNRPRSPLEEVVKALRYPEIYGLFDAKRLEKLRDQVEKLEGCLRRARELSESVWFGCYDDDD
jgi:hypothetical protein